MVDRIVFIARIANQNKELDVRRLRLSAFTRVPTSLSLGHRSLFLQIVSDHNPPSRREPCYEWGFLPENFHTVS